MLKFINSLVRRRPPVIETMPPDHAEQLVQLLYRSALGREPEPEVLHYLAGTLVQGANPATLVASVLNCPEALSHRNAEGAPLFVNPGHFYSPICDPAEAAKHLATIAAGGTPEALAGIAISRASMIETWHALLPFILDAPFSATGPNGFRYHYDNSAYSWGDGSVLHAMLRLHRPRRLIEVGSGWSSACTLDTVEHFLGGDCDLTFIEPYPELLRQLVGETGDRVTIIVSPLQTVSLKIFDQLAAGDVLFIDSTHVLRTGSDVCCELFDILPRLVPGVLVHFHDMFWPFEYPEQWAVEENRSWNELQAVRAFLIGNTQWEVLFFSDYMARLERPLLEATCPRFLRNTGGALWLRRRPD